MPLSSDASINSASLQRLTDSRTGYKDAQGVTKLHIPSHLYALVLDTIVLINSRQGSTALHQVKGDNSDMEKQSFLHQHVIIVGGGAGGLELATRLARIVYVSLYRLHQLAVHGYIKTFLITLVDRINKVIRPRLKLH